MRISALYTLRLTYIIVIHRDIMKKYSKYTKNEDIKIMIKKQAEEHKKYWNSPQYKAQQKKLYEDMNKK